MWVWKCAGTHTVLWKYWFAIGVASPSPPPSADRPAGERGVQEERRRRPADAGAVHQHDPTEDGHHDGWEGDAEGDDLADELDGDGLREVLGEVVERRRA